MAKKKSELYQVGRFVVISSDYWHESKVCYITQEWYDKSINFLDLFRIREATQVEKEYCYWAFNKGGYHMVALEGIALYLEAKKKALV